MITVIDAAPVRLPASVARAVMTCVPTIRSPRAIEGPVPRIPCRFEDHWARPDTLPSCASTAVQEKVIEVPKKKVAPLPGAVTVTVGGVLRITGLIVSVTVLVV